MFKKSVVKRCKVCVRKITVLKVSTVHDIDFGRRRKDKKEIKNLSHFKSPTVARNLNLKKIKKCQTFV